MLGPHWIRCTTKSVHTASQTKATAIYVLSELRFSCPHRKDVRSHREGPYTPSGVYQRKTTLDVIRYPHADWLKRFSGGTCVLRLATSDFYDSTVEFSKYRKTLTYKVCDAVHTCPPQIARPVYVKCEQISSDLRPGEVWCGQGITILSSRVIVFTNVIFLTMPTLRAALY